MPHHLISAEDLYNELVDEIFAAHARVFGSNLSYWAEPLELLADLEKSAHFEKKFNDRISADMANSQGMMRDMVDALITATRQDSLDESESDDV